MKETYLGSSESDKPVFFGNILDEMKEVYLSGSELDKAEFFAKLYLCFLYITDDGGVLKVIKRFSKKAVPLVYLMYKDLLEFYKANQGNETISEVHYGNNLKTKNFEPVVYGSIFLDVLTGIPSSLNKKLECEKTMSTKEEFVFWLSELGPIKFIDTLKLLLVSTNSCGGYKE